MRAVVLNCTLKPSPEPSNTEALARVVMGQLEAEGVSCDLIRLVDLNIKPGVKSDQGEGDDWPMVRAKIAASEILVMATPTWLGQHSSVCQRALERLDAFLSETHEDGRPIALDRVAGVVITGNEDGAHHIVGTIGQALIDVGFTVPGHGWTYWHLGPGAGPDYLEEQKGHDWSDRVGRNAARNLANCARALKAMPYPQQEEGEG
ncbi:MAG TPA: NAD(P)H-dependent oxidoreductase [Caulobacteraceae bacterium]|jgi:multimeric flavodoxin WrbA